VLIILAAAIFLIVMLFMRLGLLAGIAALVVLLLLAWPVLGKLGSMFEERPNLPTAEKPEPVSTPTVTITQTPTATPTVTVTEKVEVPHKIVVKVADKVLRQQGFDPRDYTIGKVDEKKASKVKPGTGEFNKPVTSVDQMIAFLKSGKPAAEKFIAHMRKQTGATRAQLLDPNNWVVVQFKDSVQWNGNTFLSGGRVRTSGQKIDPSGTVAVIFVPPDQVLSGKVTSVGVARGACTNPQHKLPKPPPPRAPKPPKEQPPKQPQPDKPPPPKEQPPKQPQPKEKGDYEHDTDRAGADESPAKDEVKNNPQSATSGAPTSEPPPAERPQGDPNGGSGDGGAPPPTLPDDNSDAGQTTSPSPSPSCLDWDPEC
jgi:hypothetical protein